MEEGNKAPWANLSYSLKVVVVLGLLVTFWALTSIIGISLSKPLFGVSFISVASNQLTPAVIDFLKFLQVLNSLGTFFFTAFLFAYMASRKTGSYLNLNRMALPASFLLVAIIAFSALPLINWMSDLNQSVKFPGFLSGFEKWVRDSEQQSEVVIKAFLNVRGVDGLLINILVIALLPAIGEELVFRGIFLKLFSGLTKNNHVAIWLTAAFFSAIHMQFLGFLPRMVMGAYLGYLLVWSGSLWLPICAHFINNGAAVFFSYYFQKGVIKVDIDKVGTGSQSYLALLASIIVVTVLVSIVRKREQNKVVLVE